MINKGSKLADFVRFCSDTYARTQQSLPPFWAAMSKIIVENLLTRLILFRMDLFGAAHGWGGAKSSAPLLPKIFHTYPTRIKLGGILPYLRKTQKIYEHLTHSLSSAGISTFSLEVKKVCYLRKYRKYRYRLHLVHNF